jgi:hypothetical protein
VKVPARVRYQYAFAAPELPPPPPEQPPAGTLEGDVMDRATGVPIAGADVMLLAEGETTRSTVSDAAGHFVFSELAPGGYTVTMAALDHESLSVKEQVSAGEVLTVAYRLSPVATTEKTPFGAVARVNAPSREIVRRSVAPEELTRMAGTRGDPLRTIELLPGVARPPAGGGMVLVRGSSPGDSEVFLNGAPVYGLYHFGGMTSVVNGFLLKGIDLYPGNFSVRYGRKTGGVVETNFRDPKSDKLHGILDVNMIDASLLVETPITEDLSIAIAGRRSYLDAWFKAVAENADLSVVAAPVYYDYQTILSYRASARDQLRLIAYGSYDELTLISSKASESDTSVRGRMGTANSFHRAQLEWHHGFSDKFDSDLMVAAGPVLTEGTFGPDLAYEVRGFDVISRIEGHYRVLPRLRFNGGFDTQVLQTQLVYQGPPAEQDEGNPAGPIATEESTSLDLTRTYAHPAAYLEMVAQVTEQLELTAGARVDYYSELDAVTIDPRLNARLVLGNTTLRAGAGLFSQPPDFTQSVPGYGNPELDPFSALHLGAGVEQQLDAHSTVSLDGFYKKLDDRIIGGDESGTLENGGTGRIYGLEVMGRLQPAGRFSGFLSYTLSRSERDDKNGEGYRLFDYDQTHILTVSGNVKLGKGWLLGSTFRLTSGSPYTPVVGSLYDANEDVYQPLYDRDVNSARSDYFHRLDVRVEKKWALNESGAGITAYLDLQNAYNRMNPEGARYNFDYSEKKTVPGLPIIPSIGLRGDL